MATSAISGEDQKIFELLGEGRLLISIIFCGVFVFAIVLWAKRQILRLFLINRKGPVERAGSNAPKEKGTSQDVDVKNQDLRKVIEENFNKIAEMRLEPKLLSDQGQYEPIYTSAEERDESNYKYRRKAFDLMSCLDELLSRVNISLARKPSQSVREHLTSLQFPPYAPFEGEQELCENVTNLYEHARYGSKEFNEINYVEYSNGIDLLYDRVHQKFVVPGSLLVNSEHHQQQPIETSLLSQSTSNWANESQMIVPSVLIEDRASSVLRNRDTWQNSKTLI